MGFVNNNLLLFLNNNLNSLYVLDSSYKMTSQIYSFFEKLKSINDYDDYIRNFPIYNVKNFKPITKLKFNNKSFSTLKIKTCVSNNFDILSNNLIKNVLPTKSETDNYLNDKELIEFTTSLQNIILDDNINKNLLELNGSKIKTDYDYLFNILNNDNIPMYDESKNSNQMEYCLIYYIALYLFVNNNTSFYTNLINLINSENKLNNNLLNIEFDTFINNLSKDSVFISNISNFISQKIFDIFQPSELFLDNMETLVQESVISNFPNMFSEYLKTVDTQQKFSKLYLKYFRNSLAYSIYTKQIKDHYIFEYFKNDYESNRTTELDFYFSDDSITQLINNYMTINNLKQYLMPIYLYKNEVYKFLNSISRFVQLYSDEKLLTFDEYLNNSFLKLNTNNNINNILNNIDSNKLYNYYNELNYNKLFEENQLTTFISFIFFKDLLKDFFNSDLFTNFIIDSLEKINKNLHYDRWITYNYNWYKNIELIRHYLMSYFINNLCFLNNESYENKIFPNFITTLDDNITSILNSQNFFQHSPESIEQCIEQLVNNDTLKINIYNINTRILDASIKKQVYFQVLSSFID